MNVFDPGPIKVGDVATARLIRTRRIPNGVVGVYRLQPRDPLQFQTYFGALGSLLAQPYRPVPGLWSTVVLLPGEDDFGLLVGLERQHGNARMGASKAFGRTGGALVDQLEVRAMLRGYLQQKRRRRS